MLFTFRFKGYKRRRASDGLDTRTVGDSYHALYLGGAIAGRYGNRVSPKRTRASTKGEQVMKIDTNGDVVMSWGELAQLTHARQVELFHFCGCEWGEVWYSDCEVSA